MITTQLRFTRLLKELAKLTEELSELGGQYNEIQDGDADFKTHDKDNNLTKEAVKAMDELEEEVDTIDTKVSALQKEFALNDAQMEFMRDSCITNRWELYADMMGAEIVSLTDIANGRA